MLFTSLLCSLLSASPLLTFHFMQVEQIIGGVNGDTNLQAIQLRMRQAFQNEVSEARIRAWDAAGANPVLIIDIPTNVANHGAGVRVLIASAGFATVPALSPDFTMTNLIPASYLAAGSLTFEDDLGVIYWRVSWGGAGYTGSHAGNVANDADGNFGPGFAGALPSSGKTALQFQGTAGALSTNNAAQYSLTAGPAVWRNNAGTTFTTCDAPTWSNYGSGLAGTIGIPALMATSNPVIGGSLDLFIGNSLGANTAGLLLLGFIPTSVPTSFGTLLVSPSSSFLLPLPVAGLSPSGPIPPDPTLCGLDLYMQVLVADSGAPKNLSSTAGLQVTFGQ